MNARTSPFRGYRGIEMITLMIAPMVEWLLKYKPDPRKLTLTRKDYDLVARWPKAGKMLGFEYPEQGLIVYKGIVLGYDRKPQRYESVKDAQ
jgi:hypothetical protein